MLPDRIKDYQSSCDLGLRHYREFYRAGTSVRPSVHGMVDIFARGKGQPHLVDAPPAGHDLAEVVYILRNDNLEERVRRIERHISDGAICVPVNSFAPLPFRAIGKIALVIREHDEEFRASYFDANIHSTGDTEQEACDNVKAMMATLFKKLNSLPADKLGPGPQRQLAVLNSVMAAQ